MTKGNNCCAYCGTMCGDSDQILNGKDPVCEDCVALLVAGVMDTTLVEETNDDFMHIIGDDEFYESDFTPEVGFEPEGHDHEYGPDHQNGLSILSKTGAKSEPDSGS